jgi:Flp pilus assembly pilin Flp
MLSLLTQLIQDDRGDDLIEYALLASAIGLAGFVGITFVSNALNATYLTWDDAVQSDALVEMPDPQSP